MLINPFALFFSTAIVLSNDQPAILKAMAWAAKVFMGVYGNRIQICDGVADNVEIQAAINALPAGGGKVILLEGNYSTIVNISVPANATLEGQGKATIITPTGAAITNGIVLNGDNITLKDMKVILAAGAGAGGTRPNVVYATGRTHLWLENLWIVGDLTVADDGSDVRQVGALFVTCTDSEIINCLIENNKRSGVYLPTASNYNTVVGNTCRGNTNSGIDTDSSSHNTITGNNCQGNNYGIYLYSSSYNTVTGNISSGNTIHGIVLTLSAYNTITGNTCQGNTTIGIDLEGSSHNTIAGNNCQGNGSHNIWLSRSSYCVITGNSCNGSIGADGINITGDGVTNSDYNTVIGNVCTGNAGDGIEIVGGVNANNNKVEGNKLWGNTGLHIRDGGTNSEIRWDVWPGIDIQEVLTQGAGKKIFMHAGSYAPIANLTVSANTLVCGDGKATIITPTGAAITNGIVLNGDNITLKDMKVILAAGAGAGGTRPNVVYATGRTLLWLEDLWLVGDTSVADDGSNSRQNGVFFSACSDSKIINCQIGDNDRHGIHLIGASNRNSIASNTLQGNTQHGVYLLDSPIDNVLENNISQGNVQEGIFLNIAPSNTLVGNVCQGNTLRGIRLVASPNCVVTGNHCSDNDSGGATFSGITVQTSDKCVITGNQCNANGLHGIYVYRSSYCTVSGNGCHHQNTGDGINITGDATTNSDYNSVVGNICYSNGSQGIEIIGGTRANGNLIKANTTIGNTGRGIVDAGANTIFDQVMHSIALDLTGGATDIEIFFAKCPCILAGYSILYSVATGAGAGVNIRVGRYQDGVALDDDYFDISVSELNKAKGYSKHFASADLTQTVIAAGDTVTVGSAGGKADTGEVVLILEIAEMSN